MDKFDELQEKFAQAINEKAQLEEEYKDKIKGDLYNKRYLAIIAKLNIFKKLANHLGTNGNIIYFKGTIVRPHKKNPRLMVSVGFELYLTDLTMEEAIKVLKMRHKNVKEYTITELFPGRPYFQ